MDREKRDTARSKFENLVIIATPNKILIDQEMT